MNISKKILAIFLVVFSISLNAATLPIGVQFGINTNTVKNNWGWSQIYRGSYGEYTTYNNVFKNHQQYIMLGAIRRNSDEIKLLAATTWSAFNTITTHNQTINSNGAEWYNGGGSLGFANDGDTIKQNSADILDSSLNSFAGINGEYRLSWHTTPGRINGGWRAGNVTHLNSSREWERIVFTTDEIVSNNKISSNTVPEPSIILLTLIGFTGIAVSRKNNKLS